MKLINMINEIIENDLKFDKKKLNKFYCFYIDTFSRTSEAPAKFILTVLFAALGSAISLSRWIVWSTKKIFPNFWIQIIGESTRSRKSTSLDIGLYFIKKMNQKFHKRNFLLPSRTSISSLMDVLEFEANGVIEHSELATFLELLKKGFNCDMKSLLTSFFDVPPLYKISFKTVADKILKYPIFSIATASTPAWLKHNLKKGDASSGFLARFLFAFQNKKTKSIAIPEQADENDLVKIENVFQYIYDLKPECIIVDNDFKQVYTEFYYESDKFIEELPVENGLKSIFSRLQTDYFLKFAILETVLNDKTVASRDEALNAKYLVAFYMVQALATIKKISPSEDSILEDSILGFIKEKGSVTKTDIYRYFKNNISAKKLNPILNNLLNAEQIVKEKSVEHKKTTVFRMNS